MLNEHSRVLEARLLVSPPQVVFRELKLRALRRIRERHGFSDLDIEVSLLRRDDPLINLGLASFGLKDEVLSTLYQGSLRAPSDELDARYQKGLRIACLSNRVVGRPFLLSLPWKVLGLTETTRLLAEGDWDEISALLSNPNIEDDVIIKIFRNDTPFDRFEDERRCDLVRATTNNPRLAIRRDTDSGPDLGHLHIQEAVIHLLETAPVNDLWFVTLQGLIFSLSPMNVKKTNKVHDIINRWRNIGQPEIRCRLTNGTLTTLPRSEDFCCSLAALYYAQHQPQANTLKGGLEALIHGKSSPRGLDKVHTNRMSAAFASDDIVLRAAYYANPKLTEREMDAGYARDHDVFVFSCLFNKNIYWSLDMRTLFEEKYLTGDLKSRFLRIAAQYNEQQRSLNE